MNRYLAAGTDILPIVTFGLIFLGASRQVALLVAVPVTLACFAIDIWTYRRRKRAPTSKLTTT
jgi:hypothetical protein